MTNAKANQKATKNKKPRAKKTTKPKVKKSRAKQPVRNWLGYSGNKNKQIETLMALIPKHTETFVDLFGGTGIVGCNAYHFNRCERVVYNDLEYDLMLTLRQLHHFTGEQVVEGCQKAFKTIAGREAEITEEGLVPNDQFKDVYSRMADNYNAERAIAWDLDRTEEDIKKLLSKGQLKGNVRVKHLRPDGAPSTAGSTMMNVERLKKLLEEGEDFQDPFQFLFLSRHSFLQTPHLKENGRRFKETPRLGSKKKPFVNIRKGEEETIEFFDAWHETPVDFFSVNFTEGWLSTAEHERPRDVRMRERWMALLESLTPKDFVFIDPPYHGSKAGYNAKWKLSMEIYLMAFCQQLDARKIPFLITNNLGWNRTIFIEWTRLPHIHTYMWSKEAALKLYSGKDEKSRSEVYVSNKCFPAAKYALPEGLLEVVLRERTEEEMPAEVRFVERDRQATYKQRKAAAKRDKNWKPESEPKSKSEEE